MGGEVIAKTSSCMGERLVQHMLFQYCVGEEVGGRGA